MYVTQPLDEEREAQKVEFGLCEDAVLHPLPEGVPCLLGGPVPLDESLLRRGGGR